MRIGDPTDYIAGMQAKGQGEGTLAGYYLDVAQQYIDLSIFSVNVFNYCELDFYLIAIDKAVSSPSGFSNQMVNIMWRVLSKDDARNFYDLSLAIMQDDVETAGKCWGTFISNLLMVEVPETTSTSSYQSVGSIM